MFYILVSTDVNHEGSNRYSVISTEFPALYFTADTLEEVVDHIPELTKAVEAKKNPPA